MSARKPLAPVVEIVERGDGAAAAPHVVVPNDVRINGQSLLCSAEHPVVVHEINVEGNRNCVYVTLTLIARRVVIAGESDLPAFG